MEVLKLFFRKKQLLLGHGTILALELGLLYSFHNLSKFLLIMWVPEKYLPLDSDTQMILVLRKRGKQNKMNKTTTTKLQKFKSRAQGCDFSHPLYPATKLFVDQSKGSKQNLKCLWSLLNSGTFFILSSVEIRQTEVRYYQTTILWWTYTACKSFAQDMPQQNSCWPSSEFMLPCTKSHAKRFTSLQSR